MRAYVIVWLLRLLFWAPLVAPIVTLIVTTAPPFYLVSLPIATLVAGVEMLWLYSLVLAHFSSPPFFDGIVFGFVVNNLLLVDYFTEFFPNRLWPGVEGTAFIGSFVGFWAATFVSTYFLWRTVRREDHQPSSLNAKSLRRGLLLLIAFAWAFIYLATYFPVVMLFFGRARVG